jgi:hypothetical protein
MKMPPRSGTGSSSIAKLFGHHLGTRETPDGQRNNPQNAMGMEQQQLLSSNPYYDGRIARPVTGLQITPAAQQQIVMRPSGSLPGGDNPVIPGHPQQIAPTKVLQKLDNPLLTTTAPMGESMRRPMGDPEVAIKRGIPGQLAMGPMPRQSGFDTRRPGAMRPIGG